MGRSVDSFRQFLSSGGGRTPYTPRRGVVAVGAGKGGVGTSLIAALLALEATRRGERVLLVDADESVGSLAMMLGVTTPGPGIGALRGGALGPDTLLRPVVPGLALLPGGGGDADTTLTTGVAERRALLRRVWGIFADFDAVFVDAGSRLESVTAACAAGVERLLCITAADRISLAASYALFKIVRTRFERLPMELIVNGTDEHSGRGLHAVVRGATQAFLGTDVRFGGTIPNDPGLRLRLQRGDSVADAEADELAPAAAGAVVHRVLAERASQAGLDFGTFRALPG